MNAMEIAVSEYREPPETYASSTKGVQRLGKLKWWFIALIAFGVAIAIIVFVRALEPASTQFQNLGVTFITEAFAQAGALAGPFDPKPIVMLVIIGALLIILLGSVWTMLRSSNASTIQAASDLTKVLVGFFVGVATKFLGT
jgi:uncharacterized membrane protein